MCCSQLLRMLRKGVTEGEGAVALRAVVLGYFLSSLLGCSAVALAAVVLWSMLGWGEECLDLVKKYSVVYYVSGAFVIGALFVLYMLDFFWPPHLPGKLCHLWKEDRWAGKSVLMLLVFVAGIGVSTMAEDYPWAPLLLTIFLCPVVLGGTFMFVGPSHILFMEESCPQAMLRNRCSRWENLRKEEIKVGLFYQVTEAAVSLVGLIVFLVWISYVSVDEEHKTHWQLVRGRGTQEEREKSFTIWIAPLMVSISFFSFALLIRLRLVLGAKFDSVTSEDQRSADAHDTQSADIASLRSKIRASPDGKEFAEMDAGEQKLYLAHHAAYIQQLQHVMMWLGTIILVVLAGNYVSYQLKPFNKTAQLMMQAFLVLLSMTSVVFLYVSFSEHWNIMGRWLVDLSLVKTAIRLASSDWARGLGVFCLGPLLLPFLLLSALNQCARRCRGLDVTPTEAWGSATPCTMQQPRKFRGLFTSRVEAFLQRSQRWDWLAVLKWAYIFALAAIIYTLTPILLKPFLAWMVAILRDESFFMILLAVWLIGLCLFLLPPVPGAPVYLFGGVLVSGKGESDETLGGGGTAGFWYGSLICIFVCLILKLSACAMQQKLIGEMLSGSLWVRRTVGVHKPLMRAIELVLRRPGLSFGKVVILCGGPDWPTSVLAGVLRLSLVQCEIGTLPIITYIAPLSLTGSFYYKRSASETWKNAGDLMFTITAVMTVAYWACIGWIVEDTYVKESASLSKSRASDVDLFWLDYRQDEIARACSVTWSDLPLLVKAALLLGCTGLVLVGQVFYWSYDSLFGVFEVTDDINTLSWYGEDNSLFTTGSLVGLPVALFCFGGYFVFSCWRRANTRCKRIEVEERLRLGEPEWKDNFLQQALQVQAEADADDKDEATNAVTDVDVTELQRSEGDGSNVVTAELPELGVRSTDSATVAKFGFAPTESQD